jgi:methionyl-tRNA formyltransferase
MDIDILIDNKYSFLNLWKYQIKHTINKFNHKVRIFKYHKKIKKGDILLILGCNKILDEAQLKLHKLNLVIHPSKLPKGRGSAALIWEVLNNKKIFYLTMFNANNKIDEGDIFFYHKFTLKGHELHNEIRNVQAKETIKLIIKFLKSLRSNKIKPIKQKGSGTYLMKRTFKDSELNPNSTIIKQFNLLRCCDNENYPAFFYYKKIKYIIKIFKENEIKKYK